ncbi:single-pass membrane and coiled-coil domain-containing protein 4 homolog [Diorhabda carinulata]|uniref:single-pass membrane and coiled-coil domain-containing protein 4 homolog n=1 Tax=Diorhabda sublineata TaxID=1163346 RepID=UPI0024E0654C|nr:single-pass membrane and coiled-coil domain-containing protein 4 homolog [Diorhabda sublineata]XP_056645382.1 single-pass membrane and coiled-coil domain-containing protein 4 homolog [Diorhabda sublineata]XP_057661226.1 single-pass membrane and coiled-coil domain-containing protein 4 homolog [Diorhabda carinulata]XP_057661234.1 single-pass membrane and coiled-coil domain-containing protein 4 homolog [Diorhabda carinulata]
MRLKTGRTKETSKEKKQRRKEFQEIQKQIKTIVLPGLIAIALLITVYVYLKTRPKNSYVD